MTSSSELGIGRGIVVRWRILAARRLDHMVDLYESGRWKLYYGEEEFLKIIQEGREALQTWEMLAPPDPVGDKVAEVHIAQSDNDLVADVAALAHDIAVEGNLRKF